MVIPLYGLYRLPGSMVLATYGSAKHCLLYCSVTYVFLVVRLFDTWNGSRK